MSDDIEEPETLALPEGYRALDWARGFGRTVGPLYYKRWSDSRRTFGVRIQDHHANGLSNAHGGFLMTLADVAWGNTISVQRSSFWVTVRLTCDFLSAAKLGEWVEAGSEILAEEGDLYTLRGRVWAGDRTLITGVGVFKAVGERAPRPGEMSYAAEGAKAA